MPFVVNKLFRMGKDLKRSLIKQRKPVQANDHILLKFQERRNCFCKMALRFSYHVIKHRDGTIGKVPLIPISLLGKEIIDVFGLVDSGSDMCCIPLSVARALGLSLDGKREKSRGIGGLVISAESRLIISVQQKSERYRFEVPVQVLLTQEECPIILGQNGFFDKFIIKFNKGEEKIILKRVGKIF